MVDVHTARLEILKVLIPNASRQGLGDPSKIIEIATALEKYVLESPADEVTPDSSNKRSTGRPRKEKPESPVPDFMTPPSVDKSNQAHG